MCNEHPILTSEDIFQAENGSPEDIKVYIAQLAAEVERLTKERDELREKRGEYLKTLWEIHEEYCPATDDEAEQARNEGMYDPCGCSIMALINSVSIDMIGDTAQDGA